VLANGINTTFLFFLCNRNPEFMLKPLRSPAPGAAPPPAPARGLDTDRLRRELSRLIEVEGAYRDPDLSLQSLSNRLGIQHHQLSQFLNEHLGMNFRSFINQSRLEEAKRLLASDERMSVLDIAFGVGFNSKSAFHSVFLKGTGLSPSEFRKMARKSPEIVQQDDVGQPSR
jgi:AraC-like DNA-binding protein